MKRPVQFAIVLVTSLTIAFMAGCEQQNVSNAKQERLIADENMQLKKQLEQKDTELQKQASLLEKCEKEKTFLKDRSREANRDLLEKVMGNISEREKVTRQENESLKLQVEELKKQLEKSVAPPTE